MSSSILCIDGLQRCLRAVFCFSFMPFISHPSSPLDIKLFILLTVFRLLRKEKSYFRLQQLSFFSHQSHKHKLSFSVNQKPPRNTEMLASTAHFFLCLFFLTNDYNSINMKTIREMIALSLTNDHESLLTDRWGYEIQSVRGPGILALLNSAEKVQLKECN